MTPESSPILYSFRRCPYAMRARMALTYAGIQCVVREVILKDKPQQLLTLSAKATVPVLLLNDGTVIDESLDIMHWACAQHDPEGWSNADDVSDLIKRNDSDFKYHLDRYKYPQRFGSDTDVSYHRKQAELFLSELEEYLREHNNLCAESVSIADVAIFPFVRQFTAVDPKRFASMPYPHLQSWLARWQQSSLLESVMTRYAQWHPDDTEQPLF